MLLFKRSAFTFLVAIFIIGMSLPGADVVKAEQQKYESASNAYLPTSYDWIVRGNSDSAHLGQSVAAAGDVNGDGYADVIVAAPNYSNGESMEGRVLVYLGSSTGLGLFSNWDREGDQAEANLGYAISTAGDVNGDGYSDVLVSAPKYDNGETDEGIVTLYLGSAAGLTTSSWSLEGNQASAQLGYALSSVGDVNGDGYSDVAIGSLANKVLVFYGSDSGLADSPDLTLTGSSAYGSAIGLAGDVNGDGYSDLVVGEPNYSYSCGWHCYVTNAGRVLVYYGASTGLSTATNWSLSGSSSYGYFGRGVHTAGDVNGDGYADIVVVNDLSWTYAYYGSSSGLSSSFGWAGGPARVASTAGDVNGDGYADLILGNPLYDNLETDEGGVSIYLGSASGLNSNASWSAESNQAGAEFGKAAGTAGDVNGDGYSDIIVGAWMYNGGVAMEGAAFVYHGSASAPAVTASWTVESDQAGAMLGGTGGLRGVGDVNGDGYDDAIVGAPYFDNTMTDAGKVWLYHGSASGLSTSPAWTAEGTHAGDVFGRNTQPAGDVNGDGYSDVLIASYWDDPEAHEGYVALYPGSASGLGTSSIWSFETNQVDGGWSLYATTVGDVNGDGFADVIVIAGTYDNPEVDEGKAWLFLGSATGLSPSPSWSFETNQANATLTGGCSAGDVNGDGYSDILLGASSYDNGQTDEGRVFLFYGSATGPGANANWTYDSNQINGLAGMSISTAGDVNGDGYSDILVGTNLYNLESNEGMTLVFHGSPTGLGASPNWIAEGNQAEACSGRSVSTAGDVNGDGYSDVLVAAHCYDNDQTDEGRAYLYPGSAAGLAASPAWVAEGNQNTAYFGITVASAGDVNGDGYADFGVISYTYDNPEVNEGKAFLYYGNEIAGLSLKPQQVRITDGPIAQLGRSDSLTSFRLAALGRNPYGRTLVKLEWELKPLGTAFDGTGLQRSASWMDTGTAGVALNQLVGGLAANRPYHWRMRLLYHPATTPFQQRSRWFSTPVNGWQEADLLLGSLAAANPPLFEKTLRLDGGDDFATAADSYPIDLGIGVDDFTIESFFYVPDTGNASTDTIVWKQGAYALYIVFSPSSPDSLVFQLWYDPMNYWTITYSTNLDPGWHHVAGVFNNEYTATEDRRSLFLDGVNVANSTSYDWTAGIPDSPNPLYIGQTISGTNQYAGWLEELRFSNLVRYTGAFTRPAAAFTSDSYTRALWHFNEAWGSTVFQDSGMYGNQSPLTGSMGAQVSNPSFQPPYPAAFDKSAPVHAISIPTGGISLDWNTSQDAVSYEYCYDTSDNYTCDAAWTDAGSNLTASISGLTASNTYFWQVRAVNPRGSTEANYGAWWAINVINSAPVITEGPFTPISMDEDGSPLSFSLHATDLDTGDTLTWSVSTPASHGSATISGTGNSIQVGYTPQGNYNGADSFVVEVSDGNAGADMIIVTVTINPVNDAPVANNDNNIVDEDDMLAVSIPGILSNDTDVELDPLQVFEVNGVVSYVGLQVTLPSGALLQVYANGGYTYDPNGQFDTLETGETANDLFTYRAYDGQASSNSATVTITINGVTYPETQSIPLVTGWNLVSFNPHPASIAILDVLASVDGSYDLVYAWDASGGHAGAGNWMRYAPGIPGNTLETLDETQGFWIRMTTGDTLEISGTAPATSNISLFNTPGAGGWNLVGYPSLVTRLMPEALTDHGVSDFSLVYGYHANDADTWKRYAPGVPGNDLSELSPGWGYWIKVGAGSTWDVEY